MHKENNSGPFRRILSRLDRISGGRFVAQKPGAEVIADPELDATTTLFYKMVDAVIPAIANNHAEELGVKPLNCKTLFLRRERQESTPALRFVWEGTAASTVDHLLTTLLHHTSVSKTGLSAEEWSNISVDELGADSGKYLIRMGQETGGRVITTAVEAIMNMPDLAEAYDFLWRDNAVSIQIQPPQPDDPSGSKVVLERLSSD